MVNVRRRGHGYERELVVSATESGLEAKRAYASNGESLGHAAGVDLEVAGKRIQAKRTRKIPVWVAKLAAYLWSDTADAVAFRADGQAGLVLITWAEYLDLIATRSDSGRPPGKTAVCGDPPTS